MTQQFHSWVCDTQENWNINSHKALYMNVHSGIIHSSQKVEMAQCPSADEQINKMGTPWELQKLSEEHSVQTPALRDLTWFWCGFLLPKAVSLG